MDKKIDTRPLCPTCGKRGAATTYYRMRVHKDKQGKECFGGIPRYDYERYCSVCDAYTNSESANMGLHHNEDDVRCPGSGKPTTVRRKEGK